MQLNKAQRDATAKALLDLGKLVVASFVIGALLPASPITILRAALAIFVAIVLYVASMWLLKDEGGLP